MKNLFAGLKDEEIFYYQDNLLLINGNCIDWLNRLEKNSVDMIFADPPYFLSSGGITCHSGKMVSVDKGEWDKPSTLNEIHSFNKEWLYACKRVLKDGGTIWISGTLHNIYSIGFALNELEYKILNNITWYKKNASPNLSCRYFTHSTETILWARKGKKTSHYFNYNLMKEMNGGKQMRDVWEIPTTKKSEKAHGRHPTQKPMELLERIILASTKINDIILDPFNGSGTTGVVAKKLNRRYIGIDIEKEYLELTIKRLEATENELELY
ncbi:DNA-methyltransferase [Parageobacillus thermoglucosidasius]|uniref:Methyltransferase n=1 Tax=Parageobacillus thermoglucosidasius TaxID=1426 RepID=A0AB38R409_PARTM|nr:site-specific DNA-methyltransferase [Parageobacillus thermoglucosidasius]UOE77487.1 site-specific DNA-methyltransferase [Parageobacillus thermoglucosidasius]